MKNYYFSLLEYTEAQKIFHLGELKHFFLTGELKRVRNLGAHCIKEAAEILTKKYQADYNQFVESIAEGNNMSAIDYDRYVKVGIPFYW